ncbi:unnamed protein product [Prunus armeniaca]|uniref:Uncharacterized protein n=1 Tax=Prunus armeniaca TaxID=36596 RepID=A0A6J5U4R1_PRUAR|nr:unnamed protein product [Prunus armeniaca]CAB4301648.1 unnamed protein product [Prunus armeniaca]
MVVNYPKRECHGAVLGTWVQNCEPPEDRSHGCISSNTSSSSSMVSSGLPGLLRDGGKWVSWTRGAADARVAEEPLRPNDPTNSSSFSFSSSAIAEQREAGGYS